MASKGKTHKHKLKASAACLLVVFSYALLHPLSAEAKKTQAAGPLVPPPPPIVVPSGFNMAFPMTAPIEYLSEDQLKTIRQDVVTKLEAAHSDLVEKEERKDELEKRAKLFSGLLGEGVVSKRELQTAERESKSAGQEFLAAQDTAKTLEDELTRIDKQLARLSKKSTSSNSNKSKKQ